MNGKQSPPTSKTRFFQDRIISYFQNYGRRYLPWRNTNDPWRILLAELLLRKTTSTQAAEVYSAVVQYSPESLASADEAEVSVLVKSLGMQYERSRILIEAAIAVKEQGFSHLRDKDFLLSIRGVGEYAANAVLCFAFGEAKPTLDRNMIRVLGRYFSYKSPRSRPHTDPKFWEFAAALVPNEHPKEYNWGVLDFASSLCTARNPKCSDCELRKMCDYIKITPREELGR